MNTNIKVDKTDDFDYEAIRNAHIFEQQELEKGFNFKAEEPKEEEAPEKQDDDTEEQETPGEQEEVAPEEKGKEPTEEELMERRLREKGYVEPDKDALEKAEGIIKVFKELEERINNA